MRYAWALLILTAVANADVQWRVRSQVSVLPGSKINLAQLIDADKLSNEARRLLEQTFLGESGENGTQTEISSVRLRESVRPVLESERARAKGTIHLIIPKSIQVLSEVRLLTPESVSADLMRTWQPLCSECRLEIESLSLPKVADVLDWTIKPSSDLPRGTFSIPVSLVRANKAATPAWVNGRLVIKRKVPVVNRAIAMNDRIQPQDVDWDYRDTSFSQDSAPTAVELIGKKARQGLRVGDIVWRAMLEKEKAIHRGELVQVRSGDSNWEVWLNVIAQQDAAVGDVINFKNPKTNSTFLGEVVGPARVELR